MILYLRDTAFENSLLAGVFIAALSRTLNNFSLTYMFLQFTPRALVRKVYKGVFQFQTHLAKSFGARV